METGGNVIGAHFPADYRLIAYDLRGFGESSKPASGYDYASFVKDLAGLMDSLGIRRAVISGHSLGALIAQDFAASHPDRVEALVLTAPQPRTVATAASDPIKAFIQRMEALPSQTASGPEWRAFFATNSPRYFLAQNLAASDVDQFLEQNTRASPAALVQSFRHIFEAPALSGNHPGTKIPTLVVYGTHDIVPFPAIRQLITDHGDSCVAVIERVGHTPPWERPDAWSQVTMAFLARLNEPTARRCR
ncbi:alpha/beta hydrolase [Phreatobacter sp.]|uniref:alpha/beta fold hydrolase n=1 Tax=Phreatobacter sp. TaxID=1966341 RepID=UPI0034153C84